MFESGLDGENVWSIKSLLQYISTRYNAKWPSQLRSGLQEAVMNLPSIITECRVGLRWPVIAPALPLSPRRERGRILRAFGRGLAASLVARNTRATPEKTVGPSRRFPVVFFSRDPQPPQLQSAEVRIAFRGWLSHQLTQSFSSQSLAAFAAIPVRRIIALASASSSRLDVGRDMT